MSLPLLLISLLNISPHCVLQVASESKKTGRKAINGTLKRATAGDRGRTSSLLLKCFFQPSEVHFPKWLSKLFWTCTEMPQTSPGCCTSSPPSQAGYPAKGEKAGCIRTSKQYSLMPSLESLQLTCMSREVGEGSEYFKILPQSLDTMNM